MGLLVMVKSDIEYFDLRNDGKLDVTFIRMDKTEAELPRWPNNYILKYLWKNNFRNPKKYTIHWRI